MWEDDLSDEIIVHPVRPGVKCFVAYLTLQTSKMYIHECNEDLVLNTSDSVLDMSHSRKVISGMLKSHRQKTIEDIAIAVNISDNNGE
jgi:hypothetical protein